MRRLFRDCVLGLLCLAPLAVRGEEATVALDQYRDAAFRLSGVASNGKRLFSDKRTQCDVCHTTDGLGGKAGPDLLGAADKFRRDGMIRAVLEPSADILPGFQLVQLVTTAGKLHSGVLRQVDEDQIELAEPAQWPIKIRRDGIEVMEFSGASLMPSNLCAALSPEEFADLVAYLETLSIPIAEGEARPENPVTIAQAARLAESRVLLGVELKFNNPVWFSPWPGAPDEFAVVENAPAKIWRVTKAANGASKELFIDLSKETRLGGVEGLLGMAFHPKFTENGRYFIKMHEPKDGAKVVIDVFERRATDDGARDSGEPSKKILSQEMPDVGHNGGHLAFGPDGYLYVAFGDGGPQEDPHGYSQNPNTWIGKVLRIDVDRTADSQPYAVPEDNPFVGAGDSVRPEIWASGFREPWRFSFDRKSGDLWVGDVGQHKFEEVSIVRRGENHGWNVYEAFAPFSEEYRRPDADYVEPLLAYSHRHGVSVTGGYVYRGKRAPAMDGWYIFGDYETRRLWALKEKNRKLGSLVEIGQCPSKIASFAEDEEGELYIVGHYPSAIYHLDLSDVDPAPVNVRVIAPVSEREAIFWRLVLTAPPPGWAQPGFLDASWQTAPGGFGSRDTAGALVRTQWTKPEIWLRREITLTKNELPSDPSHVRLRMFHGGPARVFINGVEAAQIEEASNIYKDYAVAPAAANALHEGKNFLAIHCGTGSGAQQYIDAGLVEYVFPVSGTAPQPAEKAR